MFQNNFVLNKKNKMKTKIILMLVAITVFIAGITTGYSQSNEPVTDKEKVIRIKMVKNINGVETVFDTTITGGEWDGGFSDINGLPQINIQIDSLTGGENAQVIIKTIDIENDIESLDSNMKISIMNGNDVELEKIMKDLDLEMNDAEFQKLLKEYGIDIQAEGNEMGKRVIIINDDKIVQNDVKGDDKKTTKKTMEIKVVIKTCNIEDLNKEDRKRLKNEEKSFNEKLKVNQINFYPNPNNGQFNLGFTLEKQGDTEISIFDINGKNVYNEKLVGFTGTYQKEIDISSNGSGTYYIKVSQGKDSYYKKMILQ